MGGALVESLGALVGISSLHPGDVSLLPKAHASLLYGPHLRYPAFRMLGVRHALVPSATCDFAIRRSGWQMVGSTHEFCVLQNPKPSSPFEIVGAATPVASVEAMLEAVRHRPDDPIPVVAAEPLLSGRGAGNVLPLSYAPGHAFLGTSSPRPTLLLVRQSLVPGWEARVDGRPAPLLPAAGLFFAVPLEPGAHRVELT